MNSDGGPPFFDVVFAQAGGRAFADAPVDDDTIEMILRAATHAPSAENKQPWEFIVVRDHAVQGAIHDVTEAAWASVGRTFSASRISAALLHEVDHGFARGGYRGAPILIVVCADVERGMPATVASSIFPCVQNLLLAASALGIGSAIITLAAGADELRTLLALPEHVLPTAVVPIGHPAKPLGPPRRESVADHAHRDRYGTPWAPA